MKIEKNVAIVPTSRSFLTREWLTVVIAIGAAAAIWVFTVQNNGIQAESDGKTPYTATTTSRELEVTFLDVGQGDSIFIRTPGGKNILIDAGPSRGEYSYFDAGTQVLLPFIKSRGITRIDTLVMTHPHADHYGGMIAVMGAVEVGEFLDPGLDHISEAYTKVLKLVQKKKIPFKLIRTPRVLSWDDNMLVQVLWPDDTGYIPSDPNNNSIVLRIVYGDVVYTLAGDMEKVVEEQLYPYREQLRTTVLKVPHHGSHTSSTRKLLEYMNPRLAIMTMAMNNRFNHPDKAVENRYLDRKIPVLRTDKNGTIKTLCNGKRVKVQPEIGRAFTIYPFPDQAPETQP